MVRARVKVRLRKSSKIQVYIEAFTTSRRYFGFEAWYRGSALVEVLWWCKSWRNLQFPERTNEMDAAWPASQSLKLPITALTTTSVNIHCVLTFKDLACGYSASNRYTVCADR